MPFVQLLELLIQLVGSVLELEERQRRQRRARDLELEDRALERLDCEIVEGQVVDLETASSSEPPFVVHTLVYRYSAADLGGHLREVEGRQEIDGDPLPARRVGEKVRVRYLPNCPGVSRIEGL